MGIVFVVSVSYSLAEKSFEKLFLVEKCNKIKKNVFFSCTSVVKILGNMHQVNVNGGA